MIVLGADTHKRSHTVAAVAAATGELLGEQTVQVGRRGFGALLRWARGLDGDRVWALEDCRHVSGSLERFRIERGERVLRIPTHLTAKARRSARQRGKSDPMDAVNVARAAVQEGLQSFPTATAPALHARLNRAASRLVDELAAGERVHETAHAGPSAHDGREEPTWPPSSTKTSRRSSLSTAHGPMRPASTPRSALCSAKDSAPSGSPTRFAISPATRPTSRSFCGR